MQKKRRRTAREFVGELAGGLGHELGGELLGEFPGFFLVLAGPWPGSPWPAPGQALAGQPWLADWPFLR